MEKIRILPVYPEFPDTFWRFRKSVEYIGKRAAMPPTGLATVMAMVPEDKFEIQNMIDLNVEPLTDERLINTDFVFTSTMIVQEESHNEVIRRAHKFGKKVVAGGPFATTYPDRIDADYIVAGEAEVTLGPFLEDLLDGTTRGEWTESSVAGRNNLVQLTKGGKVKLERTPIPNWGILDLTKYSSAAIQFSRGCPFNCDFCDITKLFGKESRTKTPAQMINELDALYDRGHRGSVFFVDDNFIGNRVAVRGLLPVLTEWQKERKYPFSFYTEASLNLAWDANADILRGMRDAGFDYVFLGIESVDDDVLKAMHKKQNTQMSQYDAIKTIQRAGLEVSGGFIIGSDGEKESVFDDLFKFIQKSGIVIPMPGLLTAVRGTDLYKRLEGEGRINRESDGNNTHQLGFNFETQQDEGFLIEGYKGLIGKLFNHQNYFERCRVLRDNLGDQRTLSIGGIEGLSAFVKTLYRLVPARGGWEYLKHLRRNIGRGRFGKAVTQAIKLDHLYSITRATIEADEFVPEVDNMYIQFVNRASEIYSDSKKEVSVRVNMISDKARRLIIEAEERYERLHKDFRNRAGVAFEDFRVRVNEVVDKYKLEVVPL